MKVHYKKGWYMEMKDYGTHEIKFEQERGKLLCRKIIRRKVYGSEDGTKTIRYKGHIYSVEQDEGIYWATLIK